MIRSKTQCRVKIGQGKLCSHPTVDELLLVDNLHSAIAQVEELQNEAVKIELRISFEKIACKDLDKSDPEDRAKTKFGKICMSINLKTHKNSHPQWY